jgi:phage shock protein E
MYDDSLFCDKSHVPKYLARVISCKIITMGLFGNLFKSAPPVDFKELKAKGAVIVDVRTPGEFSQGHVKGSINIPLQNLAAEVNKIPKGKPVITCCASGMRSASGKSILNNLGFEAYNGGPWGTLNNKLK